MKIEVLYFRNCPNYLPAVRRLRAILREERLSDQVSEIEVKDDAAAKALGFAGSPTIRVNGLDVDPDSASLAVTGLACRRYAGGLPSEEMIRNALRGASGGLKHA